MSPPTEKSERRLRPVQIEALPIEKPGLTLLTPGGFRVEGLSLESAAALLSKLG
jgi:hypothetical protein